MKSHFKVDTKKILRQMLFSENPRIRTWIFSVMHPSIETPTPGKYGALMWVNKGFGTFLCPRGWGICCFLLRQFCPWGGGLVRFWHSWTSEDWDEWVASMWFVIPKGGFKMDDIKVLCWFYEGDMGGGAEHRNTAKKNYEHRITARKVYETPSLQQSFLAI